MDQSHQKSSSSATVNPDVSENVLYGVTVLQGEAKSVCLLDLPFESGNITKVVDVRSVL
jgi:hypothetical protein